MLEELSSLDYWTCWSAAEAACGCPERLAGSPRRPPPDDADTGLPGFRTWRAVYAFVLGVFVLWVALLAWLTERFS